MLFADPLALRLQLICMGIWQQFSRLDMMRRASDIFLVVDTEHAWRCAAVFVSVAVSVYVTLPLSRAQDGGDVQDTARLSYYA